MAVVTVKVKDLNTWLSQQPDNTAETPYELNITGFNNYNVYNFKIAFIANPTKYVDLSATIIPDTITNMHSVFSGSKSLVKAPKIPKYTTEMTKTFEDCVSLKEVPSIPNTVEGLTETFKNCTSLTTWKQEDILDIQHYSSIFQNCSNLTTFIYDKPYELKQWLNTIHTEDTNNFPNDPDNCTFNLLSTPAEIDVNDLGNELSALSENTVNTPYKIRVTGLTANDVRTSTDTGTLGGILKQNITKYVDLELTELPNVTNFDEVFSGCRSLVKAPAIPNGVITMSNSFADCDSLLVAPTIPSGVTTMDGCFGYCSRLEQPPVIPSSVNQLTQSFCYCPFTTAPVLPESIIYMEGTFAYCSHLETVPNIPKNVEYLSGCFRNCSSLVEIQGFEADLETMVNSDNAEDAFTGCTSLTKIGIPSTPVSESPDWHIFSLNFGASTVEGKVYDKDGTSHTIAQTSITKSDLKLPILTDELWFPSGYTDAQLEAIIQKMITYRYGVFNKETIPPDEKTFVLQADNPAHFRSNLPFVKESDVVDTVASGNLHSVTSNGVFNALKPIANTANQYVIKGNDVASIDTSNYTGYRLNKVTSSQYHLHFDPLRFTAKANPPQEYFAIADFSNALVQLYSDSRSQNFGNEALMYIADESNGTYAIASCYITNKVLSIRACFPFNQSFSFIEGHSYAMIGDIDLWLA